MVEQISDALRHLEKDMADIMPALLNPSISEIILNPYRKPTGSYVGYILVDSVSGGLSNLLYKTECDSQQMTIAPGDIIIYKYKQSNTAAITADDILCWVKINPHNLYDSLEQIAFCLKSQLPIRPNGLHGSNSNKQLDKQEILLSEQGAECNKIIQTTHNKLLLYAEMLVDGYLTETFHVHEISGITNNCVYPPQLSIILKYINQQISTMTDVCLAYQEVIDTSSAKQLFVEHPTVLVKTNLVKMSATRAETIMSVLASITGKFIHNKMPHLECQIPKYGHRFTGVIPPVANFPSFCIRKHLMRTFTLDDFVTSGVLQASSRDTILTWIKRRFNILIAGGTGSGKTTLANAILGEIATIFPDSRMLIIEDVPELQFNTTRSVAFTVGEFFSMYDALRTTLRFRPERIIMGEVRGAEAYTLLKAWNTGHPGGLATIHANGVNEALYRFESCVRDHPDTTINRQEIGFTINGIISIEHITQKQQMPDGYVNITKRKVTALRQILQYDVDRDVYQDITFRYD